MISYSRGRFEIYFRQLRQVQMQEVLCQNRYGKL